MKKTAGWLLILCLAVQLALPAGALASGETSQPLTIASLVKVARYIAGDGSLTPAEMTRFDMDGNGKINIADLTRMARELTGGPQPNPPGPSLDDQAAMDMALELVPGAQPSDIREFRRDMKDGQLIYEVEIVYGGFEYSSEMLASDGFMLKWGFEHIGPLQPGSGDIGLSEATRIALDRVPGASESDIVYLRSGSEDGVQVYEGEILHGGRRYEFEIHASTGQFTEWGYETVPGVPGPSPVPMPTSAAPTGDPTQAPAPPTTAPTAVPTFEPSGALTVQEIQDLVLSYVPGAAVTDFTELERDVKYGRPVYEGELRHLGTEYEFVLDAYTGERLEWKMETRLVAGPSGVDIGQNQAQQLALAQVPGAAAGDIILCERDWEDGVPVYDVELRSGSFRYYFEIVASTGVICKSHMKWDDWSSPEPAPTEPAVPAPTATVAPTPSSSSSPYISADRAREIALAQVPGATAANVVKCSFDWEDGVPVYEVHLQYSGRDYSFEIDAVTGVILKQEIQMPAGPTQSAGTLTPEAAQQLVLSRVPGATATDFKEFKTDRDDGRLIYEGELRYDGVEYEFELDAASGTFLKWETDGYSAPGSTPSGLISRERAIQIALAQVPGATEANVRKCKLDDEHGRPIYEIEIRVGRSEYELEIDAVTGAVLEFDHDHPEV